MICARCASSRRPRHKPYPRPYGTGLTKATLAWKKGNFSLTEFTSAPPVRAGLRREAPRDYHSQESAMPSGVIDCPSPRVCGSGPVACRDSLAPERYWERPARMEKARFAFMCLPPEKDGAQRAQKQVETRLQVRAGALRCGASATTYYPPPTTLIHGLQATRAGVLRYESRSPPPTTRHLRPFVMARRCAELFRSARRAALPWNR